MAPLTRGRSTREHVPTDIMQTYYAQRASAGLIISEATGISREGLGWPYAPGLWTDDQIEAWKPVTAAVHAAGGRIVAQLWHMGRIVHSSFLGGQPPVSASATQAPTRRTPMRGARIMMSHARLKSAKCLACSTITAGRARTLSPRALTACSCTRPMAI